MTNLVEILKNAPKGLELYSPVYGKVKLNCVKPNDQYPIGVKRDSDVFNFWFDEYGRIYENGECMLFPSKECKLWPEWQFTLLKPGHFVTAMGLTFYIKSKLNSNFETVDKIGDTGYVSPITAFRFASTEEIEHFYVELRKNGYTIKNGELKPAEKCEIRLDTSASVIETKEPRLINSKPFTINDFKPFDKVLAKDNGPYSNWRADIFSNYERDPHPIYVCVAHCWRQCIPYNDETKHLLGTNEEYNGKYKTW